MSASYPLVRNLSAFSTRFGVSTQPFARGILAQFGQQLPDQILHRCYFISGLSRFLVAGAEIPTPLRRSRATWPARGGPPTCWAAELAATPGLVRRRLEAGARVDYWLGGHAARRTNGALPSSRASRLARAASDSGPIGPKGTSGWRPTWARWRSRSGCGRACKYRKPVRERARDGAAHRSGVPGWIRRPRPRPLVLQGARPVRRQRQEGRGAPPRVADVRREQHAQPSVPGGGAARAERKSRGAGELQRVLDAPRQSRSGSPRTRRTRKARARCSKTGRQLWSRRCRTRVRTCGQAARRATIRFSSGGGA